MPCEGTSMSRWESVWLDPWAAFEFLSSKYKGGKVIGWIVNVREWIDMVIYGCIMIWIRCRWSQYSWHPCARGQRGFQEAYSRSHPALIKCYPGNHSLLWGRPGVLGRSRNDFVRSSFQVARLVEFPQAFFRQLAVKGWDRSENRVLVDSIVLDCFVAPLIVDNGHASSDPPVWGLEDLGDEGCHNPAARVEVSDRKFPDEEVGDDEAQAEPVDGPLPPVGVVALACEIFVQILGNVLDLVLSKLAITFSASFLTLSESSRKYSCLLR